MGLYRDNGKENGNYCLGFSVGLNLLKERVAVVCWAQVRSASSCCGLSMLCCFLGELLGAIGAATAVIFSVRLRTKLCPQKQALQRHVPPSRTPFELVLRLAN